MSRPRPSGFVEPSYPELVGLDQQLRRRRPKGVAKSLNGLSAELADLGHLNERGGPLSAASVALGLGALVLMRAHSQTAQAARGERAGLVALHHFPDNDRDDAADDADQ
jgi:hypothetical protein